MALLPALALGGGLLLLPRATQAMTCSIGSVTGLAFGSYNVFSGAPLDTAGSVVYRCDDVGVSDTIIIQLSRGSSASYSPREMTNGSFVLEYNIYLDAAHSIVWGDGTGGTSDHGPVTPANATDTPVDVFGRIEAGQNVRAGSYSDTVVVTLVF